MSPARSGPALKEAPRAETAEALPSTPLPLLGLEVGQADGAGGGTKTIPSTPSSPVRTGAP